MSRFRKRYPDQDPPKAYPGRHLVVIPDVCEGNQILVMLANKRNDPIRSVALSLDDAEEMANLVLHLVADFRKEAEAQP